MATPKTYRKKPVEIQAIQFTGYNATEIAEFVGEQFSGYHIVYDQTAEYGEEYTIETLEGDMTVRPNDWIIRGVQGEFYPCKPDIFEATYDEVTP
jgi:hypothetical protein